jgi:Zn-dependent protease
MFGGPIIKLIDAIASSDWINVIIWVALIVVVLLFAFPLHELFHALAADKLGDPTAREQGRITLNPFKQLSLLGSVMFLVVGWGWASVPVNNANFGSNWRQKAAAVALAGPAANLLLAVVFALIYRLMEWADPSLSVTWMRLAWLITETVMLIGVSINTFLLIFNLLPIPPLDGARAFITLLPESVEPYFAQMQMFGILILFTLSRTGLFEVLVSRPAENLANLLLGTTY